MSKISKLIISIVATISIAFLSPNAVYAATETPVFGHKYNSGIGRVTIYIDSNNYPYASYWEPRIVEAVNNWLYTDYGGNKFERIYVSSDVGSQMDFHAKYDSFWMNDGTSILGETYHYQNNNFDRIDPSVANYDYTIIYINDDTFRQDSFSNAQATATLAHEMRHAFGLAHNNYNRNSIMCQFASGRTATRVQKVDNDALNRLY